MLGKSPNDSVRARWWASIFFILKKNWSSNVFYGFITEKVSGTCFYGKPLILKYTACDKLLDFSSPKRRGYNTEHTLDYSGEHGLADNCTLAEHRQTA